MSCLRPGDTVASLTREFLGLSGPAPKSDADKIELLRADLLASLRREAALAEQAERMKAERDAALADAERYRWMCEHRLGWFSRMAPLRWKEQTMKDALDAAIDAARKDNQ